MAVFYTKFIEKYKKITSDFLFNLLATFVSIGVVQLLVHPFLASNLNEDLYGLVLTLMGIANTVSLSLGGSLNNTRLLLEEQYNSYGCVGDFQLLLFICIFISAPIGYAAISQITSLKLTTGLIIIGLIILSISRNYYSVAFRIKLNYRMILLLNCMMVLGYLCGLVVFIFLDSNDFWPIIFLFGEFFGLLFIMVSTSICKEPLKVTHFFFSTLKKEYFLMISTLITNILIYIDRLILFPILGAYSVAVYTVSSYFGKTFGMVITPLSSVLLSHYSNNTLQITKKKYIIQNISILLFGIIVYFMSIMGSMLFIKIFYVKFLDECSPYVVITNATAIFLSLSSLLQPVVLKYAPSSVQMGIELVYGLLYLCSAISFSSLYGFRGFCFIALLSALFRYALYFTFGYIFIKNNEKSD